MAIASDNDRSSVHSSRKEQTNDRPETSNSPSDSFLYSPDELVFAEEGQGETVLPAGKNWQILVVDDEESVHSTTRMVLEDMEFEGSGIEFLSAYTGEEALDILRGHEDVAVVLLDVVMESNMAGLEVVRRIRSELNNPFVRIILRTGQPGQAPERSVIRDYDINDYKEKSELTAQKLYSAVFTAIRSYRDMRVIDKSRQGLETIINASGSLFKLHSLRKLASGVLTQLSSLCGVGVDSIYMKQEGFAAVKRGEALEIIAATGKFEECINEEAGNCRFLDQGILERVNNTAECGDCLYEDGTFVGYYPTMLGYVNILYMEGYQGGVPGLDDKLLRIFSSNVGIAFDNAHLTQEILETQREVVHRLGAVVETRSKETANHVLRVAKYAKKLALDAGLSRDEALTIYSAAPLHDVGKVGIPDSILLKPDKLTKEEWEIMKTHTEIGYGILGRSERPIMRAAAEIAYEHHERWDGTGYPRGLSGQEISMGGRLICLTDVFDALGSDRVYKSAWKLDDILAYLREEKGKMFDPHLVELFFDNLDELLRIREKYSD
jgi:response regulator RpfG family c-di-GMP phosphodiesterase